MAITNTALAAKLDLVATGWQTFVDEIILWGNSVLATETFTDPATGLPVAVKTPYQLQLDYDTILGPVGSQLSDANDNWVASQTMLTDALGAQSAADAAKTAAEASATSAGASETNASGSETNAATSALSAQKWADELEDVVVVTGKYSALHHAAKAGASATAAASSAAGASASETNAGLSATGASGSETNAATSATAATASATAAFTSETNAGVSASGAGASASSASTSETNAATSALSAQKWADELEDVTVVTGKYSALHHAAKASASATASSTSASNASTSATNAGTSATNASASETNATTSATNAASSETNAGTSETNAASSETKSRKWAEELEDVAVEVGKYSARHWAAKAQASVAGDITLDASKIISGTFVNARIAQSNVTQHEAALTVGESQVTGLTADLDTLMQAAAGDMIPGWAATVTGGAEPSAITHSKGTDRIKIEYTWLSGKVTTAIVKTSANSGTAWATIGTFTITYSGDNVASWSWL